MRAPNVTHATVAAAAARSTVATTVVPAHAVPAAKSRATGASTVAGAPRRHNILQWRHRNNLLHSSTIALTSLAALAPWHSLSGAGA